LATVAATLAVAATAFHFLGWGRISCPSGVAGMRLTGLASCETVSSGWWLRNADSEGLWLRYADADGRSKFFAFRPAVSIMSGKVIVRIPGGPGDPVQTPWNNMKAPYPRWLVSLASRCRAPIVNLAYTGTAPRQNHPKEGFSAGVVDVAAQRAEIERAYGAENVIVVAESLGGLMYSASRPDPKAKAILINPLLMSPLGWDRRLAWSQTKHNARIVLGERLLLLDDRTGRYEWKTVRSDDLRTSYFDLSLPISHKSAFDHLDGNYPNIHVVYSSTDRILGGDYVADFRARGIHVFPIEDLDHGLLFDGKATNRAFAILDEIIERWCPADQG
jgi:pimeloyl-ACP methyl ester carboxylesterase